MTSRIASTKSGRDRPGRRVLLAAALGLLAIAPPAAGELAAAAATSVQVDPPITINGAVPSGPIFSGVGALDGGGTARLLIDYPEPQRSQILDYLFKPGYGASLQMLKLEIGGDAEATDAAEPSFEHTQGQINCNAGYEIWLAQQARLRNPHIALYALQWNAPGWVGNGVQDPWTKTDISYLLDWLNCAKKAGLTINYLGGWNEHVLHDVVTPTIINWFISLRAALNANGYQNIKIVAMDTHFHNVANDFSSLLAGHPAFSQAISVLGYHDVCGYPTTGLNCYVPPLAKASGKAIWATEVGALRPPGGNAAFARAVNNAYIQAKASAILEYPLIASMPGGLPEEDRGVVQASQPWSGNYQVSQVAWVTAQTTQVTEPDWLYVTGASGQFSGSFGNYVGYEGPGRAAWSLVVQTSQAPGPQQVTVHITGGLPATVVHVWSTNLASSDPAQWFVQRSDITPAGGSFTTTLLPGYVYSFTTTTTAHHGTQATPIPAPTPMPMPYTTTPTGSTTWPQSAYGPDQSLEPWGLEPADGSFEYPTSRSPYFVQTTAGPPDFWQPSRQYNRFPYAVFGDYCLGNVPVAPIAPNNAVPPYCGTSPVANYTVSATVTFTKAGQSAGVIARYYRPVTSSIQFFQGYLFTVPSDGNWQVLRYSLQTTPVLINHGTYSPALGISGPHTLSLTVKGSTLTPSIDGNALPPTTDATYPTGVAGISTGGWYPVQFDTVTVGP